MLLALTGYETALVVVAAVFIAFALAVALVVPRTRPEFPGKRLGIFVAVCIVLFAAQITAILALAELGEGEAAHAEGTPTEPGPGPAEPGQPSGDAVAGKEIFVTVAQPSCGSCHTLSDAGTTGTVGPNLDATKPPPDLVVQRVSEGQGAMPSFKDSLSEQQIQDVAAYVSSVAAG